MANQRLQYTIAFTADTEQAKRQLKSLQNDLTNLVNGSSQFRDGGLGITREIAEATNQAALLKAQLQLATNQDTGKLNLTKFSQSLRNSGNDLTQIRNSLYTLGRDGQQSFVNLAAAITNAETPLISLNSWMTKLGTTFLNTIRWQISTTALNTLIGSVQTAYRYAQDLDKSLNNIRIVTEKSTDQMAKFAVQANKAAKSLSTTTTAYTDAALIYYQQGLTDDEVLERTNATIKMANVTGENAEHVSSYMTAIWNNFDDGSKSIEYYADVITALGAATAASSEEIAGGLEKFASVAETVGLSYEYATSALTTIIDVTRQSEDVVGTSLKTIFARLQGLSLGETLEDGVNLNKYSTALETAGIQVVDQMGNLREMDDILNDLGNRWSSLSKSQQVALAQTVGGVRQYTQLIALMDNWDKFQQNVMVANLAEGTLTSQNEIYEESWEASINRVKASLETIYDTLIDEEFFIGLNDALTKILDTVNILIKSFGGLKGILFTISGLLLKQFETQAVNGINNIVNTIKSITPAGRKAVEDLKQQATTLLTQGNTPNQDLYNQQYKVMTSYLEVSKQLTEEDKKRAQYLLEQNQILAKNTEEAREQLNASRDDFRHNTANPHNLMRGYREAHQNASEQNGQLMNKKLRALYRVSTGGDIGTTPGEIQNGLSSIVNEYSNRIQKRDYSINLLSDVQNDRNLSTGEQKAEYLRNLRKSMGREKFAEKTNGLISSTTINDIASSGNNMHEVFNNIFSTIERTTGYLDRWDNTLREAGQPMDNINQGARQIAINTLNADKHTLSLKTSSEHLVQSFNRLKGVLSGASAEFVKFAQGLASTAAAISSLRSLKDVWSEDNTDDHLTKILSTVTTLGFALPQLYNGLSMLKTQLISLGKWAIANPMTAGAIAAVTVAVIALVAAWKHYKENKPEEKIKKLGKEAKEAAKEVSEVTSEMNELNNTINSLKDKQNALKNLNKDTLEYKQSVLSLNEEMLKFIELHELWSEAYIDENGLWQLKDAEKVYREILQQKENLLDTKTAIALRKNNEFNKTNSSNTVDEKYKGALDAGIAYKEKVNEGDYKAPKIEYEPKKLTSDQEDLLLKYLVENQEKLIDKNNQWVESSAEDIQKFLEDTFKLEEELAKQYVENIKNEENKNIITAAAEEKTQSANASDRNAQISLGQDIARDYLLTEEGQQFQIFAAENGVENLTAHFGEQIQNRIEDNLSKKWVGYKNKTEMRTAYKDTFGISDEEMKKVENEDIRSALAVHDARKFIWDALFTTGNSEQILQSFKDQFGTIDNTIIAQNKEELYEKSATAKGEDYGLDYGAWTSYQKSITDDVNGLADAMKTHEEIANVVTEKYLKWYEAATKVNEVLKDNKDALNNPNDVKQYGEALTKVADSMEDLFGFKVDSSFVEKNLKKIKHAFKTGSKEEMKELFEEAVAIEVALKVPDDEQAAVKKTVAEIFDEIDTKKFDIGKLIEFDKTELDSKLFSLAEQVGWTADKASNEFEKRFGIKIKYETYPIWGDFYWDKDGVGHKLSDAGPLAQQDGSGYIKIPQGFEFTGNPGTGGGGGGKKPSGGGSKKKDKKQKSDEIERYHEIRNTIEDLNKQLDETNKKKDRAFGKGKLKAYDDEINKLNELKDAQEQYLDEIDSNLKKDKNAILKYGVKFDENGNISNYDEVMEAQLNKFNKKRTEKAEKEYEEFKKLIAQYEETHDLMLDEQAKLEDLQNQIHDEGLAAAAYKVEYQIELNDDDVEFLDYLIDQLSDNVTSLVEKIALIESKMVESLDNYGIYMDGIKDIFTNLNATRDKDSQLSEEVINRIINGDFTTEDLENWGLVGENSDLTAEDMSKLSEYRDSLLQTAKDLSDYQAAIYETISEGVEKTNAEFDKYSERLEHMFGLWEHFKNIVELTGNKYLGISKEMILALNKDAVQSKVAQVSVEAENLKVLREQLAKFQDENGEFLAGNYANTTSSIEDLKKEYENLQAAVNEAENNLLSSWEDALSAANDLFQMSVETAIAAFEEGISGTYGSLDMLQDAYDKQKDLGDLYLDDYKQIYELSKLTRDINKSIDDTDNIASKNKLKEIQQEINDLQEAGVELSQYDLDFLRAKYELRLAEIALEDAQNAKSQVRMTRDNEGNWSYTYTADQDNIDKAQQNYEDKLYAIQNLTSNYITTVEEQILALQNSMVDEMAGVDKTLYASEEEYLARLAEIQDYYTQKMNALSGQINNALGNNKEIYENDWKAYSEATDYKISANERYIDSWNETQLSLLGGYETLEDYQETFMSLLGSIDDENSLIGQLASAYRSWSDVVEQISAATGMSIDELAKKIQTIPEESKAVTDEMKAMSEEMATAWEGILQGLQDFTETLAETLQGVLDDVKDSVADLIALMKALYNYEESPDDGSSDPGSEPPPVSAASGGYTGSWGASGKLAILHEKELILNAEDTRNMLKVVGMTRDIAKQIELNAIAAGSGLSNFAPGSVGQFQQVEQNIVINADFPNASNREEIAAAFDNLLNRASQYANRK